MAPPDITTKTRQCRICGEEKPYTPEHWPVTKGRPTGLVCRPCSRHRARDFQTKYRNERVAARTMSLKQLAKADPAKDRKLVTALGKGEVVMQKLEVTQALREGAAVINRRSRWILARLLRYLHDPSHPHHEWAFKFIMERAMPRKLYEDLGANAAGIKRGGDGPGRPNVTIIVQPATAVSAAAEPSFRVIDHDGASE